MGQVPVIDLPVQKPFLCPICQNPSRDKITLLRHYAFGHKKVFEICNEGDFEPRPFFGQTM